MVIEWTSILLIAVILVSALGIIKIIDKTVQFKGETKRKLFHITMGLTMLIFPYIFKNWVSVGILGIIALVFMFLLKKTKLKDSIGTVLYSVDRDSLGEVFFVISVFTIFYWSKGDKILFSIPILVLTFADSVAALIGKNYAKKDLAQMNEDSKSIEGSFMFFIVAFMATLVPILLFTEVGRAETLIISLIIGFNVSLIEMISHTGNDNLFIPLTTYALLVTHIEMNVQVLVTHLIILGIIFILSFIANRVKVWSKLAIIEALVVGYLMVVLYGWYAMIPPLILFLTVMRFPRRKESEESNLYDARIIETNIIIGIGICGLVAVTGLKKEMFMIYSLCFAMHLIINTYVRLKYYFKMSDVDNIIISLLKGAGFIFVPSLIVQKIVFGEMISPVMFGAMCIAMILSSICIYKKKKDVKEEVISIDNGIMHTRIVLALTLIVSFLQLLQM